MEILLFKFLRIEKVPMKTLITREEDGLFSSANFFGNKKKHQLGRRLWSLQCGGGRREEEYTKSYCSFLENPGNIPQQIIRPPGGYSKATKLKFHVS